MTILGLSAFYHDSAAAIIQDGEIIAAAQEERFTRKKHDPSFPVNAIEYCIKTSGVSINDLKAVVFYDKPLLKFERLLDTYYSTAPKGVSSFITAMPVWLREKLFLKKIILDGLNQVERVNKQKVKLLFPEHHLSHAASAFYPSPYDRAAIITVDGVGEWATTSICLGEGNKISVIKQLDFPHSLGLLYSAFTYFCGFKVNSGEYKLMGLAPFSCGHSESVMKYIDILKSKLIKIREDGSFQLNQEYFTYSNRLTMVDDKKWKILFGFERRRSGDPLEQKHSDLAFAVQTITDEIILRLGKEAKRLTGSDYLCMAGGVALNCVATGKLHQHQIFKDIFIQPAAGDAGGALGAAFSAYHIYYNVPRRGKNSAMDALNGSYLGPEYTQTEVRSYARKLRASFTDLSEPELLSTVANLLSRGKVIGWFQGRMEFGPRALGCRSILADSRDPGMQKKLNLKIKFREAFRPFAPAVLFEDVQEYFDHSGPSPYMTLVKPVVKERQIPFVHDFKSSSFLEKLNIPKSDIPAVTHVDYSARIQTVHRETNPLFWNLLQQFKKITGCPLLINTSFNVRGEPIVNTPEDAYHCFMRTEMDYLVIGSFIFEKAGQPAIEAIGNRMQQFEPD